MVLRRFHPAVGSGPSFAIAEGFCSADFPALPAHGQLVQIPPYDRIF